MEAEENTSELSRLRAQVAALEQLLEVYETTVADQSERLEHSLSESQKRTEALEDSETRFKILVEHSPEAIVLYDVDSSRLIDANQNALELFGMRREEILKLHPADLSPLEQPGGRNSVDAARIRIEQALAEDIAVFEWMHINANGICIPCEVRLVRLPAQGHNWLRASIIDISERKNTENTLREARDAAEEASRAKSSFLANMSHEIRTPLNAVIGMTEFLLDTELSPLQLEYLTMVRDSGEALLDIVNDVLDFSKIEAGQFVLDRSEFNLRERLEDVVHSVAMRAHARGLEIGVHVASDVPEWVIGDPLRVRQVILNLVGNAIKFTEQGEVIVDVRKVAETDKNVDLQFSVSDTGLGVPREKQADIFKEFVQADSSLHRRFGGTGLGLAITARLVRMMEGRIWLESEAGQGSQFHFIAKFGIGATRDTSINDLRARFRDLRVLVLDDHQPTLQFLAEMLQNWGIEVLTESNPDQAMLLLRNASHESQPFHLALIDTRMPDRDGLSVVEEIRRENRLANTHIILLTTGSRSEDEKRYRQSGVEAWLVKPARQSEIQAALTSIVAKTGKPTVEKRPHVPLTPASVSPLKILLAEDSIANQKLAVGLLKRWGHNVQVANNGREAVEMLKQDHYDLVLMDIQMPEMDGLAATSEIRSWQLPAKSRIPIIAMTAHAMKGDREHCLSAGMDGYVSKPIRQKQFYEELEKILTRPKV